MPCMQEKRNYIWCVKKLEISFSEIGFMDYKWSSFNAPGPYTSWSHSYGVLFVLHAGKGNVHVNKVEISFAEIGFVDCKWLNLNATTPHTPWCYPLFGSIMGCYYNIFENWRHGPCACVIESSLIRTQRQQQQQQYICCRVPNGRVAACPSVR